MTTSLHLKRAPRALSLNDVEKALVNAGEDVERRGTGLRVPLPAGAVAYFRAAANKSAPAPAPAQPQSSIELELECSSNETASILIDFAFKLADDVGGTLHKFPNGPPIGRGTLREALVSDQSPSTDPTDGSAIATVCGVALMAVPIGVLLLTGYLSIWLFVVCFGAGGKVIASGRRRYF